MWTVNDYNVMFYAILLDIKKQHLAVTVIDDISFVKDISSITATKNKTTLPWLAKNGNWVMHDKPGSIYGIIFYICGFLWIIALTV